MSKQQNKNTGNRGEGIAAEYLVQKGYEILGRNYQSKWGEIDIICKQHMASGVQQDTVVFVEVKTKTTDKFGEPWEMVNHWKIEQVKRMGEVWCKEYAWEGRVRVDVVGVYLQGAEPGVRHWENVEL